MKIVLDTNVLISALINEGKPRQLLFRLIKSKHDLITSEEILEELAITASEPRIQKYVTQQDIADFLRDVATASKIVEVKSKFNIVKEDHDDDTILSAAFDSRASYMVSGDRHLLEMGRFRRTRIVTVDEMFRLLG